ncbi:hypothetical protein T492DRAFT_79943 [Pavlovales sp. CCMP2436]|nr:hypothetical protein T492DRAFT_79943 [Pavlovales sp. CCMP2436]
MRVRGPALVHFSNRSLRSSRSSLADSLSSPCANPKRSAPCRQRVRSCSCKIRCSTDSRITTRLTVTARVWPIRWTRLMACKEIFIFRITFIIMVI